MKEINKKKGPNNNQTRRSVKPEKRENRSQDKNGGKTLISKEPYVNVSSTRPDSSALISDSNTGMDSEVYENMDIHYMDDAYRSDVSVQQSQSPRTVDQEGEEKVDDHSTDMENDHKEGTKEESDLDASNDSLSSQGDGHTADDVKIKKVSVVLRSPAKNDVVQGNSLTPGLKSDRRANNLQIKSLKGTPKQTRKPDGGGPLKETTKQSNDNSKNVKIHPKPLSESSEGVDDMPLEDMKEADALDEASNSTLSVASDDEIVHNEKNAVSENQETLNQKIEEMQIKIGKLEQELREVAALEIALYSVASEHGSSAHKVHTPARRLSRLYLHACKYWSQDKRATFARNTVSGLVLIGRSCGNDVPRLTFWLSNTVVLRESISQAFASSLRSSPIPKIVESNGGSTRTELKSSSLEWKSNSVGKQGFKQGLAQFIDDWQETRTFTAALEKLESWIFSRIVESIWWQTLTPNMQSPTEDSSANKALGRLLGPALGDQQQGSFSINLWKNAFQDASRRLCPVRATGHECGCLPFLARKVMDQCVGRLDVAMFNAILRESAHEIPTDPVSDPIVDSKVLPIPAGDLSFGSGAQLKNSVGNWSRCLANLFGVDADNSVKEDKNSCEYDDKWGANEPKCFHLLNELSDLLMLPKDMVVNRAIRMEVCPSIGLPVVKRILCNFSPDEFCPDPVPGEVLEALNAECIIERRLSGGSATSSFPRTAGPITYIPPSSANVAEKVAEAGGNHQLSRNASDILKKGYTSDEEVEDLDSPLTSIVGKLPSSPITIAKRNGKAKGKYETDCVGGNARYELLREVWLTT